MHRMETHCESDRADRHQDAVTGCQSFTEEKSGEGIQRLGVEGEDRFKKLGAATEEGVTVGVGVKGQERERKPLFQLMRLVLGANMSSVTVVASGAAAVLGVVNMILLFKWAPGPGSPCTTAGDSCVTKSPLQPEFLLDSAIVMMTNNQSFIIDPATAKHSLDELQTVFNNHVDRYKDETNKKLLMINEMLSNVSQGCAQNVSDVYKILNQTFVKFTLLLNTTENHVEMLNITVLVLTDKTKLLEVKQEELLTSLGQTSDKLGQMSVRLDSLEGDQKETGDKAELAYSRSLKAIQSNDLPWSTFVWLALGVLALDVPLLLCVSWCMMGGRGSGNTPATRGSHNGSSGAGHPPSNGFTKSLQPVTSRLEPLHRGVCVLGFDAHSLDAYSGQVEAVTEELGQLFHRLLLGNIDELGSSEIHQTVVVIIPFNERNVILEEPHLLQGEAKVKTVRHLISRGVDVFVMYCGDKDSATLPPRTLYNPLLTSVESHQTLSYLNAIKRVMSIHSRLNDYQREHLLQYLKLK